jgi:AraC family transcriptional regulator
LESWETINAIQRMQNYIEQHIVEPISLHNLAQAAGYSPWHAARLFKEFSGKSPFEYIRMLRLSRAAVKLQDENSRVVDVAFDFVFQSHEGFTRAFSRQFGLSPQRYRKVRPEIKLFMPEQIHDYYQKMQKGERFMSKDNKVNTVFVQVVDRPARKLIIKRGAKATHYFEYCEKVGCGIWNILSGIKEALYEPIGMWLPDNLRPTGSSLYAQGVEVPANFKGSLPDGYELIDLKPCKMMVFQGQPYQDEKFEDAIGELWDVMKTYNPEIYGFRWADEDGPRFQLAPMGYRGYIEARPVRQINTKQEGKS